MTTSLSDQGLLEIPQIFRQTDAMQPGQRCDIERVGHGEYRVRLADDQAPVRESWVQILKECPFKDWWEPLDHSSLLITRDNTRLFDETDETEL